MHRYSAPHAGYTLRQVSADKGVVSGCAEMVEWLW